MIEIREDAVRYQAKTKIYELALETAETKNLKRVDDKVELGAKIFKFCQALDYGDYLTAQQRGKIVRTLVYLAGINDFPVAPYLGNTAPPSVLTGIPGRDGEQGPQGPEGGGVPFSATNVTQDTVCDSFAITESRGAEWQINIYGTDSNGDPAQRTMRIIGGWTADGTHYGDDGGDGTEFYGDTSEIAISVVVLSGTVRLFAAVTGGDWTVEGTRKHIPNNGSGIVNPTTLASGRIWVGNASNTPTAVTPSGDVTIATNGTTSISAGVIVNADISGSAAISVSKLAALTASRAIVTDASGVLTAASVTATELGYLSGVTGSIQTALDSKVSATSGAISTVVNTNLSADRVVISNPSGKIAASSVTTTKLTDLNKIVDGTYTPTYTLGSDWTGATAEKVRYTRVIDTITVTQRIEIVSEADGQNKDRTFYISLPVSATFSDADDVIGVATGYDNDNASMHYTKVTADTANNRAQVVVSGGASDATYIVDISFVYKI